MDYQLKTKLNSLHAHCTNNRSSLEKSSLCGCFYCGNIFSPALVTEYADDGKTALCPFCGIDSVLPDSCGTPLTKELLDRMHMFWFGEK